MVNCISVINGGLSILYTVTDWLSDNREWFFSGAEIALITFFALGKRDRHLLLYKIKYYFCG